MIRKVVAWVALGAWMIVGGAATTVMGCGSGVSADEAKLRCDQERTNNASGCITDEAYQQCLSCEEECGDQCARLESCPIQFACAK